MFAAWADLASVLVAGDAEAAGQTAPHLEKLSPKHKETDEWTENKPV